MNLAHAFPAVPDYGAHWIAVFWEPIFASGERMAILVAARDEQQSFVQATVPEAVWQCFLGRQAGAAQRLVKMVGDSLRLHLDRGGRLSNWTPPLSGISCSEERYARAYEIGQIVRMALTNSSAFATLPDKLDFAEEPPSEDNAADDRWPVQIRTAVGVHNTELDRYFERKISLRQGMRSVTLDYAGPRYCANFTKLVPDIRMGYWLGKAKIKLLDLEQIRSHVEHGDLIIDAANALPAFELITYRPAGNDPAFTDRAMTKLNEAMAQLEDFADSHQMKLAITPTAEAAAARLIAKEAA